MDVNHANLYGPMTARRLGDAGWQTEMRAETLAERTSLSLYHTLDAARRRNNENCVVSGADCELPPWQAPMAGATEVAMLRMNLTPYSPRPVVLAFLADSAAATPKSCGEAAKTLVASSRKVDAIR